MLNEVTEESENSPTTQRQRSMKNIKPKQRPIKINVGGIPYVLTFMPWKDVDHSKKASGLFGEVDYLTHSIHVASDVPKEKQQLTVIHETLHAIISEYNIREMKSPEGEHYEHTIDLLSLGLCSVLKSLNLEIPHES